MLKGELVLSSDSAAHLIARGFGAYLGVSVRPWTGKTPTHECFSVGGNKCNVQVRTQELVPTSATTRTLSTVCHSVDKVHFEPLFPGVTVYENELGGRVTVFCGTPKADYNLTEAFSFLNESRKHQLIEILQAASELPVYYPGDEEVYFRVADMEDGGMLCAIFDLSCDPLEDTALVCASPVTRIEHLTADGRWEKIAFLDCGEGRYQLDLRCEHLDPVILRLH
jgi:hypothetical protein